MNFCMDMHTHTIASGHGYSTLEENIEAAKKKGLLFLGMSEHAPALPGAPNEFYFNNYRCIPRKHGDLRLFCGMEANIMDYNGNLDVSEVLLQKVDYVIASMHIVCVKPGTKEENTKASIAAIQNPYVTILGHPDDSRFPLDYKEVILAAKEEKVAVEINNSSLHPMSVRQGAKENILELLSMCKEYEVPVLLGSDSHISFSIGDFEDIMPLLLETEFPERLILNTDPESIKMLAPRVM